MSSSSFPKQRILVTGADGQLGRALQKSAPKDVELHACDKQSLDITDRGAVFDTVETFQPDWLINAAAYTAVDQAEKEREVSFSVNAEGPHHLAQAVDSVGARMVHVSTDFVFDGKKSTPYKPDDKPNPLNVYGESKLSGEQRVQAVLEDILIFRTAWLYAVGGQNFVSTMVDLMRKRNEIHVVGDQVGTPTEAGSLARSIWAAVELKLTGIYHWTNAGVASWYDFAVAIQEEGLECGLLDRKVAIMPIPASEYAALAERPVYSILDKQHTWEALGQPAEHWRTALRKKMRSINWSAVEVDVC